MTDPSSGTLGSDPAASDPNGGAPADAGQDGADNEKVTVTRGELKSWKSKAEKVNTMETRLSEQSALVEQLVAAQRAASTSTTTDPNAALFQQLQEQAQLGNPLAIANLATLDAQRRTAQEQWLTDSLDEQEGLNGKQRAAVRKAMRTSNFQLPIEQAVRMAKLGDADQLQAQVNELNEKLARLTAEKETSRTLVKPLGGGTALTPAPEPSVTSHEPMVLSEYLAALNGPNGDAIYKLKQSGALKVLPD